MQLWLRQDQLVLLDIQASINNTTSTQIIIGFKTAAEAWQKLETTCWKILKK